MQKGVLTAIYGLVIYTAMTIGCMDRAPAPVCPVPTEINQTDFQAAGFDGVDLLVVVDNSKSMKEEQQILATGFFTLINSLVNPTSDWPYPPVDNMRVAVVSSDMGLQWGEEGSLGGSPVGIPQCDGLGDNGEFQLPSGGTITVESDVIQCEVDAGQCPCETGGASCPVPSDWSCTGGTCSGPPTVNCPSSLFGGEDWAENSEGDNLDIAREVACMSDLGITGCGFEQQLEASVKGLSTYQDFMKPEHLLAVLVVSDEEDCSIADSALFSTAEWDFDEGGYMVNVACNWHDEQPDDQYLFPTNRYMASWLQLKGGMRAGVVFAAIVGVPRNTTCQGGGNALSQCLAEDEMQYVTTLRGDPPNERTYFAYACQRAGVTDATPGRRYVEVAQEFGDNGYVYSICNEDWSPAMADIANLIAVAVGSSCYEDSLVWAPLSQENQELENCLECGTAVCNLVYEYEQGYECDAEESLKACEERLLAADPPPSCPEIFGDQGGELRYEMLDDPFSRMVVTCIVPKLPAPFKCSGESGADAKYDDDETTFGWYYCENEDCRGGVDEDGDECCRVGIKFTSVAKEASTGQTVKVQCLQEFTFEDPNCQENTQSACDDEIDNDGNGVWDCMDDLKGDRGTPHRADRNCCIVDDATCEIDPISYGADGICTENSMDNHSDACRIKVLRCCLQDFGDSAPEICEQIRE
ncbi:MAG: hypothetical protein GY762_15005 [Proteobacteria bacterium]|nr:hypothetical protein [Pseudomonadota bacterium]